MNSTKNFLATTTAIAAASLLLCGSRAVAQPDPTKALGVNFVSDGNQSGVHIAGLIDSLLPGELAGAYAQSNWNNCGRYGSGSFVLTNSAGSPATFTMNWDSGYADSTGSAVGLGTPDGKLMNGYMISWGPGAASPLANSIYGCSINNKPIVYLGGLSSWYSGLGAEGYAVVLYTKGNTYYETTEGWIQSVSGDPTANTMVEGADLSPHKYEVDSAAFTGTFVPAVANPTYNANYMFFSGFTNDAVLLRCQTVNYGAGLNGFQVIPIYPTPATAATPTFSPSDTTYAGVPVTLTEVASGDPFYPTFWYQWQSDNGTGNPATNNVLNATNATLTVNPTNNVTPYTVNYRVIVTNIFGASTSSVVTLNVNPAVPPFVTQDTTPGAGNGASTAYGYVGGSISFNAVFGGTLPITYNWQSNTVTIPNATNTSLTLANLQLGSAASYGLQAANAFGSSTSTPTALTVQAVPAAPTSATAYPNCVFTNGPSAYWRLTETIDTMVNSVQAYDYSGNNNNATYGANATDNQAGPQSPAFPGFESTNTGAILINNTANSFLTAPALNLNTNTVTITAWINPIAVQSANNALFTWSNGGTKAGFRFASTNLGYIWNSTTTSSNFNSGLYPPVGLWSFVALTITPSNSTIYLYYVDTGAGVTNLGKAVQSIANAPASFSGGTTWIGSDTTAARNFNGYMDEVAVFNKALSEAQVQDLFLKALGVSGIAPVVSAATVSPSVPIYSGQNVSLAATANGTIPLTLQWQAGPDGSTWTNLPGANANTLIASPLTVGTVHYRLTASNSITAAAGAEATATFNALPVTPPGVWTVNFEVTNNVINYSTGSGIGRYVGRGILGTGMSWNILPHTAGAFGYVAQITSTSDLKDDGVSSSGITCIVSNASAFGSGTSVLPAWDIGQLLNQWVTIVNPTSALQFTGVPAGTYNLACYGVDGTFADRGTTFIVHDGVNGNQTNGTVNVSPGNPLSQGMNFVLFTNVHASGTLVIDIPATTPVPSHDPNTEADFNAAQLQLVSLDPPLVFSVTNSWNGSQMTLSWPSGSSTLLEATNIAGPWTTNANTSPYTFTPVGPLKFFRVRIP